MEFLNIPHLAPALYPSLFFPALQPFIFCAQGCLFWTLHWSRPYSIRPFLHLSEVYSYYSLLVLCCVSVPPAVFCGVGICVYPHIHWWQLGCLHLSHREWCYWECSPVSLFLYFMCGSGTCYCECACVMCMKSRGWWQMSWLPSFPFFSFFFFSSQMESLIDSLANEL